MSTQISKFILFILSIFHVVYSASLSNRIVNGTDAKINDYPFMASLLYVYPVCGGTILNANTILTAANCFEWRSINYYSVRIDSSVLASSCYGGGQLIKVAKLISHEQYNRDTRENDIGLIKLKKNIEFGTSVAMVKLPKPNADVSADVIGVILGWGTLCINGSVSKQLQRAKVPVVDRCKCKKFYESYERIVTQGEICAGKLGVDACRGDSGGPLIVDGEIVGIISSANGCGTTPTIYTRVSCFIDWINKHG